MLTSISPHELPHALDGSNATILSLDCFDTLLWRLSHAPRCIFGAIGPAAAEGDQRRHAEGLARAQAVLTRNSNEATLAEIYDFLLPGASADERAAALRAELEAEARACFAFAPTVALMREARRRGLKIVIVSDTYLDSAQLRALIEASAGAEVAGLIDTIFASSDHGRSKGEGLFRDVLRALQAVPADLLHIGDNSQADAQAPARLGIPCRHLRQFLPETEQRLRLEAATSAMLHGGGRASPAWQYHRAAIAVAEPQFEHDALRLGHSVLGPMFTAFDQWLKAEAAKLAAKTAGKVHALFLLRDGHLPHALWEARGGSPDASAARVEISRFCATAASFRSLADIDAYLVRDGGTEPAQIARQLLAGRTQTVVGKGAHSLSLWRRPREVRDTIKRSQAFARRLVAHVRAACDPRPGDTLMLVDLGYNGTVQNGIDGLLADSFGVAVAGRYLLLREDLPSGLDKLGMIDHRHYDMPALTTLCDNIAAVEQLATIAQGSVVDYEPDGTPIRSAPAVAAQQSVIRDGVQAAALEFGRGAAGAWTAAPARDDEDSRREAAAAILARFLFLPLPSELCVLESFEHDVNLGGKAMVPLFDREAGSRELRRRGIFYLKDGNRMCLPAELRGQGLPLSLALLAQRRFGLDLRKADFDEAGFEFPVLLADGTDVAAQHVPAARTHDGYFSITIPVGQMRYSVGLQFGRLFEWVQLEAAHFLPLHLITATAAQQEEAMVRAELSLERVDMQAPGLLRCSPEGFVMIPPVPAAVKAGAQMVLVIVFRPIIARSDQPAVALTPTLEQAAA